MYVQNPKFEKNKYTIKNRPCCGWRKKNSVCELCTTIIIYRIPIAITTTTTTMNILFSYKRDSHRTSQNFFHLYISCFLLKYSRNISNKNKNMKWGNFRFYTVDVDDTDVDVCVSFFFLFFLKRYFVGLLHTHTHIWLNDGLY